MKAHLARLKWLKGRGMGLGAKLIIVFILSALVLVTLIGFGVRQTVDRHFEHHVRPHIITYFDYVQKDIVSPPNFRKAERLAKRLHLQIAIIHAGNTWHSDGVPFKESEVVPRKARHIPPRLHRLPLQLVSLQGKEYLMMLQRHSKILFGIPELRPRKTDQRWMVPMLIIIMMLMIIYAAIQYLFSPIRHLEQGVKRIGQGDLAYRIDVERGDELGRLAHSINSMASDIQHMLDAKRQMLLAISHELRTPITRAKVAMSLIEAGPPLDSIGQDLDEMVVLIERILESERLSSKHEPLNLELIRPYSLIGDVVQEYFPHSNICISGCDGVAALMLDRQRMSILLKNLIDNALKYTESRQPVDVCCFEDIGQNNKHVVHFVVKDCGVGIAANHLAHLTEPFYRADPSRQRKTGGVGLGLYLCKMIAESHGGQLLISSELGHGTTATASFPRDGSGIRGV